MNLKGINFKDIFHGFGMKVAEAKPEIMLVSGIVSVLIGTVYACTKTPKAKEVIEETKKQAADVEAALTIDIPEGVEIAPETVKQLKIERGRNFVKIYGTMMYRFIKLYGLPALLWFGGMGMICGGHGTLRRRNMALVGDVIAGNELMKQYRERVAKAVGDEVEQKIFHGVQEGMVNVVEIDEKGNEKLVQKKADVFVANPGSPFARNFTPETSDEFDIRYFAEQIVDSRIDGINKKLDVGMARAYSAMDILRMIGFNENAFNEPNGVDEDKMMDMLLRYGISGNARKVPDPEMRKLKVTKLKGYQKTWDVENNCEVYKECLRLDFNFYPLEGKI